MDAVVVVVAVVVTVAVVDAVVVVVVVKPLHKEPISPTDGYALTLLGLHGIHLRGTSWTRKQLESELKKLGYKLRPGGGGAKGKGDSR